MYWTSADGVARDQLFTWWQVCGVRHAFACWPPSKYIDNRILIDIYNIMQSNSALNVTPCLFSGENPFLSD
jgi:hypothetical protein